ncbi:hypothetical protein, partial [Bordetella bronchiseptica]|uniref:hypothetical protein n=1 Tax=Bordetella bronchiseptica TaxID=518 RepID=UPI001F3B16F1
HPAPGVPRQPAGLPPRQAPTAGAPALLARRCAGGGKTLIDFRRQRFILMNVSLISAFHERHAFPIP